MIDEKNQQQNSSQQVKEAVEQTKEAAQKVVSSIKANMNAQTEEAAREARAFMDDLEEEAEAFQKRAQKKYQKYQIEEKAAGASRVLGHGVRQAVEFATDSLGLILLKNQGKTDLAYKVIKSGRSVGAGAENVVASAVRGGGKVVGTLAGAWDVSGAAKRVAQMKDQVLGTAAFDPEHPENLKNKVSQAVQKMSDEAEDLMRSYEEDPKQAQSRRVALEKKLSEFQKLYDEEAVKKEHANEGYHPEETKEKR
ncbi:hypothetical protein ABB02_01248 [Clostridiaceae bacterium JG1575]|nr:hypothetical protein ABB02_01248 [Clostridiaceae bacterium JG1575]